MNLSTYQKSQLRRIVQEVVGRSNEAQSTASIAREVINTLETLKSKIEQIDNPDVDDAYGALLSALKAELES